MFNSEVPLFNASEIESGQHDLGILHSRMRLVKFDLSPRAKRAEITRLAADQKEYLKFARSFGRDLPEMLTDMANPAGRIWCTAWSTVGVVLQTLEFGTADSSPRWIEMVSLHLPKDRRGLHVSLNDELLARAPRSLSLRSNARPADLMRLVGMLHFGQDALTLQVTTPKASKLVTASGLNLLTTADLATNILVGDKQKVSALLAAPLAWLSRYDTYKFKARMLGNFAERGIIRR